MARDILNEYGPDHHADTHSPGSSGLTTDGGKPYAKGLHYSPPAGPNHQNHEGPGLRGGVNVGHEQMMNTSGGATGTPGNHGTNHGNKGSQGSH